MSGFTRSYSLTRIGALVVISGSLFLSAFGFMTNRTMEGHTTMLYIRLPAADGLKKGDAVLLRGVQVGEVRSIDFHDADVLVKTKLTQQVPLTRAANASLVAADMFGRKSLVLSGDTVPAAPLASGDTLAGLPAASMTASIERIGKNAERIINDTTAELLQRALSDLAQATRQISALAVSTRQVVESRAGQIDSVSASIQAVTVPAARTLAQLDSTSAMLHDIAQGLQNGEGTAGKLLRDDTLYLRMNGALAGLEALLVDVRKNPKRYINVKIF